jgi:hypothetical protein
MDTQNKINHALTLARSGAFGTPDNQDRLSSGRLAFWRAFEGKPSKDYRGTLVYPYAKAGEIFAKEKNVQ